MNKIRIYLTKYSLLLILVIAFSLRVYKVTSVPPSLNWDETSIAYNAYSILKTGRDEWGQLLPLHFKSFGEYKLPGQIYASIPAIAIFGLNEFGVRITPVVYGTITIYLLYLLVQEMFKKKEISLLSAFFLAISPWHIQLTRSSFESSFSVFWVVMGIWMLLKGLNGKSKNYLIFSMLPFAISIYTYNSARAFTPIFLFVIALMFWKYLWKSRVSFIGAGLFFALLLTPLIPFILSGEASARYKLVSITDDAGLIPRIEGRRNNSHLPEVLTKLIHNRYTYNTFYFSKNYLAHFTPNFLFIKGAPHHQHHVQGVGELYWIQAPYLLYGIYLLLKKKNKSLKVLFPWLFISFIPVSLTNDSIPNALRTLIAAPVYQIFTAYGIYYFLRNVKDKKVIKLVFMASIVIFVSNFIIYLNNLFVKYPILYSRDWQYGYKQAVEYIKENQDNYNLITFSRTYGEPHIFTLFNLKYPPEKYFNSPNLDRYETYDWVWVLRFDKYYFPDLGDEGTKYEDIIKENPGKKILFIGKPGDFPENVEKLKTIKFLDGETAFEIVSN